MEESGGLRGELREERRGPRLLTSVREGALMGFYWKKGNCLLLDVVSELKGKKCQYSP